MMIYKLLITFLITFSLILSGTSVSLAESAGAALKSKQLSKDRFALPQLVLTQEQWSIPKRAESILQMPALIAVMKKLTKGKTNTLVIRSPGGEMGILWASELKAWLVSLGLSSNRIELQTGSLKLDQLELFVNS